MTNTRGWLRTVVEGNWPVCSSKWHRCQTWFCHIITKCGSAMMTLSRSCSAQFTLLFRFVEYTCSSQTHFQNATNARAYNGQLAKQNHVIIHLEEQTTWITISDIYIFKITFSLSHLSSVARICVTTLADAGLYVVFAWNKYGLVELRNGLAHSGTYARVQSRKHKALHSPQEQNDTKGGGW